MSSALAFNSRYPFFSSTRTLIREQGITLGDLIVGQQPRYRGARLAGMDRLVRAVEGQPTLHKIQDNPGEQMVEILAYLYARLLTSASEDQHVRRRFSIAEGKRFIHLLQRESPETIQLLSAELGVEPREDGKNYLVPFPSYLQAAAKIRGETWKLVNRPLAAGRVRLTRDQYLRMLETLLTIRLDDQLAQPLDPGLTADLVEAVARLEPILEQMRSKMVSLKVVAEDEGTYPPCIGAIIADIQQGINAAHAARFALATFLNATGHSEQQVMGFFARAPDFREDMTRYQVEHISRTAGGYKVPSCDWMKTNSICIDPDDLCKQEWMDSPWKYVRVKNRPRGEAPSTTTREQ